MGGVRAITAPGNLLLFGMVSKSYAPVCLRRRNGGRQLPVECVRTHPGGVDVDAAVQQQLGSIRFAPCCCIVEGAVGVGALQGRRAAR
jgi:hypothetical protein